MFSLALLGVAFAPSIKADDYDKKTTVTFSAPVEIPPVYITGMRVLPAGTYVFKLLNSSSNRHIVQVFNQDQTKIIATILAIPNYRLTPTDKTVITFNEGLKDKPEAIRAWFYPGANWGEEFVYPKAKAVELAKATSLPVLALPTEVKAEVAKPEEPQVVTELTQAPVVGIRPTGDVVELAQVVQSAPSLSSVVLAQARPPAAVPVPEPAQALEKQLPATASPMPLIGLCGLLMLGASFAVRSVRRRTT
jgi:hypothetical protein